MTATVITRARARYRNINSARFAAASRGKNEGWWWSGRRRRGGADIISLYSRPSRESFRSLELDLIKIRAGEALTPPIKSLSNSSPLYLPVRPLVSRGENHRFTRERYPPSIGPAARRIKGETFRADLTDLPQINTTSGISRQIAREIREETDY